MGNVIFELRDSRSDIMVVMDGRVFRLRYGLADRTLEVWGPGSWGRTNLCPRSSGGRRQAVQGKTGLDQVNTLRGQSVIQQWMRSRG